MTALPRLLLCLALLYAVPALIIARILWHR